MRIKKTETKAKVNEHRVCAHLARMAQVAEVGTWREQRKIIDQNRIDTTFPWAWSDIPLVERECDTRSVYVNDAAKKMDPDLLLELLGDPGAVLLVQDSMTTGPGSIWLMSVGPVESAHEAQAAYAALWPVRMFVNAFENSGIWWQVMGVQVSTVFRQTKP